MCLLSFSERVFFLPQVWYTTHATEAGVYKRDLTMIWAGQVHTTEVTAFCVSP